MTYLGNAKSVQALTVYEVWRDRFLRDRLRPAVGIAIFFCLLNHCLSPWRSSIRSPGI